MTAEPALREVPWWEDDAYRESLTLSPADMFDFLMRWMNTDALAGADAIASAMKRPISDLSYWQVHPNTMTLEEEARLRFVYRVLVMIMNYAGSKDFGHDLFFQAQQHLSNLSIFGLMGGLTGGDVSEAEILRQTRIMLEMCWRDPPESRPDPAGEK
jgi:hypothetical protein